MYDLVIRRVGWQSTLLAMYLGKKSGLECKKKEDKFDMETLCKMVAFPQPLDLSFRLRRLLCSLAIPVFYDMIFSRL